MNTTTYTLDDQGEPLHEPNMSAWATWMADLEGHRRVAFDELAGGEVTVSTVFLGIDRSFGRDGPPVLWETLVGGGPHDGNIERYTSRAAALEGHQRIVEEERARVAQDEQRQRYRRLS